MQSDQTYTPRDPRARGAIGNMRASDADREAMAEILRRHYAAGRLDAQEFEERIDRCYAAKRLSDLDELLTDLPREQAPKPAPEPGRPWRGYRPRWGIAAVVPIVIALIALHALTGGHFLWLLFPLIFFLFRPFGCWFGAGRGPRDGAGTRYV